MSDITLIDWDDYQARLVVGSVGGGKLRVSQLLAAPLGDEATAADIADALRPLISQSGASKSHVVVVIGGRDVQSRLLQVPPVPDEELPDLVRLRAGTEFPAVDETAIIDYVPIGHTEGEPVSVLAARAAAQTMQKVQQVCEKLHITPQHVAMRGCGITSLGTAAGATVNSGIHLIASRRNDELDLVGTSDGNTAVVRTVPMPAEADVTSVAKAATREIRRTIAAVGSELGASDVASVQWMVGDQADREIAEACSSELGRSVSPIDMPAAVSADVTLPAGASSFAGMLGAGLATAERRLPLDFLAPRKPPEVKRPITAYALAASLAGLALLGGGWFLYSGIAKLEKAAAVDIEERSVVQANIEDLAPERKQSEEVQQWLATDVNWLDEMNRIVTTLRPQPLDNHDEFNPERDVLLTSLVTKQAAGRRGVGGTVDLAGQVRDDAVLEEMEDELRAPGRQVNPKTMVSDSKNPPYVWTFQNEVVVTPQQEERQ